MKKEIDIAIKAIQEAKRITAFTGAGISVESGIPSFRGSGGIWNKYNPECLVIDNFKANPLGTWKIIKEVFYDFFGQAKYNLAHSVLAHMEQEGMLQAIVTQNIDYLHQMAGSKTVFEFHGNSQNLVCLDCGALYEATKDRLNNLPPKCEKCNGLLKPDFVFFGEAIPEQAFDGAMKAARNTDLMIVIGTTGEVMPACSIPHLASEQGATIIEINTDSSAYTNTVTDIFLKGKATEVFTQLQKSIF